MTRGIRPPSFWLEGRSTPEAALLVREAMMLIVTMEGWYEYGEGHMELDEETGRLYVYSPEPFTEVVEDWASLPTTIKGVTYSVFFNTGVGANMMPELVADELEATRYISMQLLDAREGVIHTFQAVTLDVTIGEITQEVDFQLYPSSELLINFGVGAVATFKLSFAANGSVLQTVDSQPPKPLRTYCAGTVTYPQQDPGRESHSKRAPGEHSSTIASCLDDAQLARRANRLLFRGGRMGKPPEPGAKRMMPIAVMEGWYEYGEGHMELDEETGRLYVHSPEPFTEVIEDWASLPTTINGGTYSGFFDTGTEANMMPERVADELRATRYISMRLLDAREGVVLTFQAVTLDRLRRRWTSNSAYQLRNRSLFAANGSVFQTIDSQPPKPLRAYCAGTVTYPRQDPGRDESTPPVEEPKERTTKRAREEEETERAPPRKICVTEKPHKRTDGVFVTPPNPSSNGAGPPICPVFPQRAEDQLSEWAGMRFNDHAEPMAT
ncbi:hypothetical protein TYRP_020165, partial [Tyrophagus putrescentiae]